MGRRRWVDEDEGWVGEDEGWVDGDGSAKYPENEGWIDRGRGQGMGRWSTLSLLGLRDGSSFSLFSGCEFDKRRQVGIGLIGGGHRLYQRWTQA